ncbi:MAG TPA: glucokinase [Acidimicrobiales bacterium]|nr:glucokinase [Acidimicrobiales bacterium]
MKPSYPPLREADGIVVGIDVGGTWSRFGAARVDALIQARCRRVRNADLESLEAGIVTYLADEGVRPAHIVIGVTGERLDDGRVAQTNVPRSWPVFNWRSLQDTLGIPVSVYNDLAVSAVGIQRLEKDGVHGRRLLAGTPAVAGSVLTVGVGTGLGDAFLDPAAGYIGQGEPGHQPFAPRDEVEDRLLALARAESATTVVSFEDLASGSKGLPRLYRLFRSHLSLARDYARSIASASADLEAQLRRLPASRPTDAGQGRSAADITRTDVDTGSSECDPIGFLVAVKSGDIVGTYIGARAVAVGATGGVKLVGGVLTDGLIRTWQAHSAFERRIREMGVHARMTGQLPVDLVTHRYPGVIGALELAARHVHPSSVDT